MWIVFIGGAMVTRRNTHIAVELLSNVMKPGPVRATLLAFVDFVKLAFLVCSRSFPDDHRTHALSAYDGVRSADELRLWRCRIRMFPMLIRQAQNVWRNARIGWSRPDDVTHQVSAD